MCTDVVEIGKKTKVQIIRTSEYWKLRNANSYICIYKMVRNEKLGFLSRPFDIEFRQIKNKATEV